MELNSEINCVCADVCDPIVSVDQLLNRRQDVLKWCDLVEPLVERSRPRFLFDQYFSMDSPPSFVDDNNRPEVLVCHDYKGNYLDDKYINGTIKWEEYRFYNWSAIDWFCYFSHNLVSIPTLQFINAAKRNGVKVLGTLIFENENGRNILHNDILSSKDQVHRVADSLVEISKRLHFEGWLLNVEVTVDDEKISILKYFVEYITKQTHKNVPKGRVIWYDSVTKDGRLAWQNELNVKNESFFNRCDGIFTNYNWSIQHLEQTSKIINEKYPDRRKDVFFGIDVFGRGQIAGFRIHETLSKSCAFNFSSAIFAPGWTYETIDMQIGFEKLSGDAFRDRHNKVFLERNDRFWCSMYKYFYVFGPKKLPFVTNFCIGSGKKLYRMGLPVKTNWFNMKLQSFQPSTPSQEGFYSHYFEDSFDGGSCLSLDIDELIRLFVAELPCDDDIIFSYTFKRLSGSKGLSDVQVNLNILNLQTNFDGQIICGGPNENPFTIKCLNDNDVKSISIYLASKRFATIPGKINGWRTRYYLLKFNKASNYLITDIGLKKIGRGLVLLGNMSFYSAQHLQSEFSHIQDISI